MRFILVDRIVSIEPGKQGSFVKNVSQSEDYFTDHFPQSPIMPGVLILESFDQAAQFFVARSHDFACYPELKQILRASFRHYVVPGDQLNIALQFMREDERGTVIKAHAQVDGRTMAEATLLFSLVQDNRDPESKAHCQRLGELYDLLSSDTVGRTWESLAHRF